VGTVRFAITSEAGFNDGLAFPLTNLAIAAAGATLVEGTSLAWLIDWALVDVLYKIGAGIVLGYVIGELTARLLFRLPAAESLADMMARGEDVMAGVEALSTTLIAYSVTELLGGYGFIAVFVAALGLRHFEWEHDYYVELHDFAVVVERLLMATVLVLFGGAVAGGLLGPLTWLEGVVGLRASSRDQTGGRNSQPSPNECHLAGTGLDWILRDSWHRVVLLSLTRLGRVVISRNRTPSSRRRASWAFVGFVVLLSVVLHGVSSSPIMDAYDRLQQRTPRIRKWKVRNE